MWPERRKSLLRVAIVHDWLVTFAGAEQVLAQILQLFPQADIFTVVDFLPQQDRVFLAGRNVQTSFVQQLPGARKHYRSYLPLMPWAVEKLDLSGYDLVLSSSHAVAKGVNTSPQQHHICYCHSPMRYAWDMREEYLREAGISEGLRGQVARFLLERLRRWDLANSAGVHAFLANSAFIAERIKRSYNREAVVVYPPVDTDYFTPYGEKADFYLAASRMVPYKRMKLIVQAFSRMPQRQLVVIGDGPQYADAMAAAGPNIRFLGYQPKPVLRDYLRQARALVFAAKEDFGILPVEAQACGTPVIAFGEGGVLETVRGWGEKGEVKPTGLFFSAQAEASLIEAVEKFEMHQDDILPEYCRENALNFSPQRFQREFVQAVQKFKP
jgi:glycosyltransferase involved in cell wall biosynthesis